MLRQTKKCRQRWFKTGMTSPGHKAFLIGPGSISSLSVKNVSWWQRPAPNSRWVNKKNLPRIRCFLWSKLVGHFPLWHFVSWPLGSCHDGRRQDYNTVSSVSLHSRSHRRKINSGKRSNHFACAEMMKMLIHWDQFTQIIFSNLTKTCRLLYYSKSSLCFSLDLRHFRREGCGF